MPQRLEDERPPLSLRLLVSVRHPVNLQPSIVQEGDDATLVAQLHRGLTGNVRVAPTASVPVSAYMATLCSVTKVMSSSCSHLSPVKE